MNNCYATDEDFEEYEQGNGISPCSDYGDCKYCPYCPDGVDIVTGERFNDTTTANDYESEEDEKHNTNRS